MMIAGKTEEKVGGTHASAFFSYTMNLREILQGLNPGFSREKPSGSTVAWPCDYYYTEIQSQL
jgi:hypothetical protein